jgi:Flp pilus assembly protein protease CpaA
VWRRILPDLLAGAGFLALAYLASLYAKEAITFTNVIAVEAIVLGISVVLYAALRDMF